MSLVLPKREIETIIEEGDRKLADYLNNRLLISPVYAGALEHGDVYQEIFSIKKTYLNYMPYVVLMRMDGVFRR